MFPFIHPFHPRNPRFNSWFSHTPHCPPSFASFPSVKAECCCATPKLLSACRHVPNCANPLADSLNLLLITSLLCWPLLVSDLPGVSGNSAAVENAGNAYTTTAQRGHTADAAEL